MSKPRKPKDKRIGCCEFRVDVAHMERYRVLGEELLAKVTSAFSGPTIDGIGPQEARAAAKWLNQFADWSEVYARAEKEKARK